MYKGLTIIFGFWFVGELLVSLLKIPVPGNVVGMLLFTYALILGVVDLEDVDEVGTFLLRNMSIMFIPPGVEIVVYWSLVKENLLPISVALIVSFILTIVLTAKMVELIRRVGR
ncbi:effector of murein hydrolase LrgA [Thermosulfidibacter takaii ABI70S6]|uniref:Effector of murein hydrolase LrgA n=1 Tax=Thermosulfidibacter takaii (strain DSM 17441 / JCM 13301 / NBRC 103674 / ABI70S6) TaxID=1298851 RepID=A0A0S3QUE0_THET7|nr:CidA/LrgA family protein [Thermosulfidibacter takaii]BAT71951.1 effector of murein hydrolase LrgA [Thermosulfidibacter takaii ABI70S6]